MLNVFYFTIVLFSLLQLFPLVPDNMRKIPPSHTYLPDFLQAEMGWFHLIGLPMQVLELLFSRTFRGSSESGAE